MSAFLGKWLRPFVIGIAICLALLVIQPSSTTDRRISDALLVGQDLPADPEFLLIEITGADLNKYGRPILSHANMTRLLNVIEAGEPKRVLFDFRPGETIEVPAEIERAEAMERFAKGQLGIVVWPGAENRAHERFLATGTVLDGRLTPDVDGWHRKVGRSNKDRGANPAIWLSGGTTDPATVPIDLRIGHQAFERASADDVFEGRVELAGRMVIVSASPDVAPTQAYLPQSGTASRATVLAAAAQSVAQGYPERRQIGARINLVLTALAALLGIVCAMIASSGRYLLVLVITAVLALAAAHMTLVSMMGVPVTLVTAISCFLIMVNAALAHRIRIVPLMQNFMRGDLSPEEAWAWRAQEESEQPAILIGANNLLKRANRRGLELREQFGEQLASKCALQAGKRPDEIIFSTPEEDRVFEIDWPYPHVAIAVLRDVTAFRQQHETLLGQLHEDDLTGCSNRRGLERALVHAARDQQNFELFFIDLNGFKQINDTHGHDAGDELLVEIAQRLRRMVRSTDLVARLGGDEFAVLFRGSRDQFVPEREVMRLVDQISAPIRISSSGIAVSVGASIGHASSDPLEDDVGEILRRADQAMYRHKAKLKTQAA
ncbi:diguanylate cyclase domain-containing protein [Altererythrobacter sp. MF3-039]|uniref:diguanylate cyclase domain-containing protein n=1 Tax=Altererythrobacter sp. MF3-039 TaxID=3252901 RepID=UPI00390C4AAA